MKKLFTLHKQYTTPEEAQYGKLSRKRKLLLAALLCLLVIGTFLLNVVVLQLAQRYTLSTDLTANAAYEAGAETKSLLTSLNKDVEIFVLSTEDSFGGSPYLIQAQRMMEQYPKLSSRVKLNYVDYVSDPTFASKYPDLTLAEGNVLVTCDGRVKQLQLSSLFNYTYTQAGSVTILSSRTEEALTSAIVYVISDEQVRVAMLTGNGVADMPAFTALLTDNNYTLSTVNLTTDELDSSYDLAVLLAPQIDLSEDVLRKLDDFLYNGGTYGKTLFYAADVTQDALPNLEAFLKEWGIAIGDGAVFETTAALTYQYQPYYPVAQYVDEAYKKMLIDSSTPVLMPLSRPLEVLFAFKDNNYNEVLLQFGETSGVRPSGAQDSFAVEQAEKWGPMPALVMASKRINNTEGVVQFRSNLLVSASTAMLDAFSIQNTSLSNSEYMLNLFNTLFARTDVVNIQPKSLAGDTLSITTAQASTLGILLAGVLPLLILAAGVVIWLVRRYQ